MHNPIDKTAALIEAHEYIKNFSGKAVVVKVGGSIMDDPTSLDSLLVDICFMAAVGMRPMIVHGGGKAITQAMGDAGLESRFVQGRRYTDERTLAIAEHVLVNQVNKRIVSQIQKLGHQAMGLSSTSSCIVTASRLFLEGKQGRQIDVGMVGQVEKVNARLLEALSKDGCIPVIAPLSLDRSGGKLNVNADSVAGHVASAVKAEKLVLISDTHGIRQSEDKDDLAPSLTRQQIEQLIDQGIVLAGMLPKVEAAFTALNGGVRKAHIIDGRIPHALLLEIYTDKGIGTQITT